MRFNAQKTASLKKWISEAEKLGIAEEVQRGLMFCIGFTAIPRCRPNSIEELEEFLKIYSNNITDEDTKPKEYKGDFLDNPFSAIFYELADKILGEDFRPRPIPSKELGQGQPIELEINGVKQTFSTTPGYLVWKKSGPEMLPNSPNNIKEFGEFLNAFYRYIGENLKGGIESAYLAGIEYLHKCYFYDQTTTQQIAELLSAIQPPQFMYLFQFHNINQPISSQHNDIQKIVLPLLMEEYQKQSLIYKLPTFLNAYLEDLGANDFDINEFVSEAISQKTWFDETSNLLEGASKVLIENYGFTTPKDTHTTIEAMGAVAEALNNFGFDLPEPNQESYLTKITRRALIIYIVSSFAILNPKWNKSIKTKEENIDRLKQKADKWREWHQCGDALYLYDEILRTNPPDAEQYHNLRGMMLRRLKRYDEALQAYSNAMEWVFLKIFLSLKNDFSSPKTPPVWIPHSIWYNHAIKVAFQNIEKQSFLANGEIYLKTNQPHHCLSIPSLNELELYDKVCKDGKSKQNIPSPIAGLLWQDYNSNGSIARKLMPNYFYTFLKKLKEWPNCGSLARNFNNRAKVMLEAGNIEEAKATYKEAIYFTDERDNFPDPYEALESIKKTQAKSGKETLYITGLPPSNLSKGEIDLIVKKYYPVGLVPPDFPGDRLVEVRHT